MPEERKGKERLEEVKSVREQRQMKAQRKGVVRRAQFSSVFSTAASQRRCGLMKCLGKSLSCSANGGQKYKKCHQSKQEEEKRGKRGCNSWTERQEKITFQEDCNKEMLE